MNEEPDRRGNKAQRRMFGLISVEQILAVGTVLAGVYFAQDKINQNLDRSALLMNYRMEQVERSSNKLSENVEDIQRRLARKGI